MDSLKIDYDSFSLKLIMKFPVKWRKAFSSDSQNSALQSFYIEKIPEIDFSGFVQIVAIARHDSDEQL